MIYVMSDIHGQKRRFDSIMKQIKLQPEDTLYVLGDVIDRNPDGIKNPPSDHGDAKCQDGSWKPRTDDVKCPLLPTTRKRGLA